MATVIDRCPRCGGPHYEDSRICIRCSQPSLGTTLRWFEEGRGRGNFNQTLQKGFKADTEDAKVHEARHQSRRRGDRRPVSALSHYPYKSCDIVDALLRSPAPSTGKVCPPPPSEFAYYALQWEREAQRVLREWEDYQNERITWRV